MPSDDLTNLIRQLEHNISTNNHKSSVQLLRQAKVALLHKQALVPTRTTPSKTLQAAQYILELGALISIRLQDTAAFTRYFQQLQPFYSFPTASQQQGQRSKVTGLYLLLLLSQHDYGGFHTLLESLDVAADQPDGKSLEDDEFIQYPIRLEQWLMEGSYDRVWDETKSERVPSDEFAIFSDVSLTWYAHRWQADRDWLGSHRHYSLRSGIMLRESIPIVTRHKCEKSSLLRQRG